MSKPKKESDVLITPKKKWDIPSGKHNKRFFLDKPVKPGEKISINS